MKIKFSRDGHRSVYLGDFGIGARQGLYLGDYDYQDYWHPSPLLNARLGPLPMAKSERGIRGLIREAFDAGQIVLNREEFLARVRTEEARADTSRLDDDPHTLPVREFFQRAFLDDDQRLLFPQPFVPVESVLPLTRGLYPWHLPVIAESCGWCRVPVCPLKRRRSGVGFPRPVHVRVSGFVFGKPKFLGRW